MKNSIRRITELESRKYIPVDEDYTDSPIKFYTITPTTNPGLDKEDGWEDVTYFTDRSRELQFEPQTGKQFVYILTNPLYPGYVKIGFTKNHPEHRSRQISSSTGVPMDFKLEYVFECFDGFGLEQEVHKYLSSYRLNKKREFFKVSIKRAKEVIEELGVRYNVVKS